MFTSTGGTFTGTPEINTTYYTPCGANYMTFTSIDGEFTINNDNTGKTWDGVIEYATDVNGTWTEWNGTSTISSVDRYLYMRGYGNSVITGVNEDNASAWRITGSNVRCTGNIENLLDFLAVYRGEHPTIGEYCFKGLFSDCAALIEAPELPSMALANNCYDEMFKNCTSLAAAPALPATTLAEACYEDMFLGCTSLVEPPELPARTMETNCYCRMFSGCTALSHTPALPATTLAESCYNRMFNRCV